MRDCRSHHFQRALNGDMVCVLCSLPMHKAVLRSGETFTITETVVIPV